MQMLHIPTTTNGWVKVKLPTFTGTFAIPITCNSSPPIPLAFKVHSFRGPLIKWRLANETVAPVSTKHFCSRLATRALMKTAVGWIQLICKALLSWADSWPNNESALGRFPALVDVPLVLGTDTNILAQDVRLPHRQSSTYRCCAVDDYPLASIHAATFTSYMALITTAKTRPTSPLRSASRRRGVNISDGLCQLMNLSREHFHIFH